MFNSENIICISSIDWDFIWQGHQEIMSRLAKGGNRVLFIENTGARVLGIRDIARIKNRIRNWLKGFRGIREENENLYVFSPVILPFPYSRLARFINRRVVISVLDKWMKVMDFGDPIVWTFLPTPLSLDIADNIIVKKALIYYCIDDFSASSAFARKIKDSEERLLKKADLVFVTSKALHEKCSRLNPNVHSFSFGVSLEKFDVNIAERDILPEDMKAIKRPIVGYIGGVHKWINQDLVKGLAEKNPAYSFVFIGPIQADIKLLTGIKNIYFLGKKEHYKLPLYIRNFDVGIIPYLLSDYTINVYPTKLNEYLIMGKSVVSTSLPEIVEFEKTHERIVYVAEDAERFDSFLKNAVMERKDLSVITRRMDIARKNSWENKIEKMNNLIESSISAKRLVINKVWRDKLVGFYMSARRRMMKLLLVLLFLYLLLFKTSFLWFMASPLRIEDIPDRANAIVVFGGGVGETGSPGKSTIERARYAAELYKKGYASSIIFSSGYTYFYNDAENMGLFAVSMGVPREHIILEQQANSTYENVVYANKILDKNKWNSILLVSSPYNMKRAQLVFNKAGKGIAVIYTPVKRPQFYDREIGIKFEQIKAIVHEYLGILYYWFKGYI